jgi:ABC-type multidrug transport system fused ATPase/permease subunit
MEPQHRKIWPAATLLILAAAAAVFCLFRLSQPDRMQTSLLLNCTQTNRNGWTFETESGPAEPVFGFGGYLDGIPVDGDSPVAAERVMEEPGQRDLLQFFGFGTGIQVFLDGELLYTDFPNEENRADSFLEDVDFSSISHDGLCIPLPIDCAGKTLRIVTYDTALNGLLYPTFPSLVSRFSDSVTAVSGIVWPMAVITAQVILALFLLLVFLFSAQTGPYLWKLLPLSGYFLLTAVPVACGSFFALSAGLDTTGSLADWLCLIYIDLLFCFLAISLHGWKRRILLIGAATHILCSALRCFTSVTLFYGRLMDWLGFGLFLLAVLLMLLSHERMLRRTSLCLCCVAGALFAAWCVSRFVGVEYLYPLSNPITSLLYGNPKALYTLLCAVTGLLCAVQVVAEFIRTAFSRQRQMIALQSRSQQAQEQYRQAQESLRNVSAFRHEWKNHVAVLWTLTQKQDLDAIHDYLSHLGGQLEQLSPKVYTANPTVNTILQRVAAQTQELGIAFRVSALLPESLSIDEGDLCGFLFNLLDNALEAAAKVPHGEIICSLQIRQQYLAIRCENIYDGTVHTDSAGNLLTTKDDPAEHGFGLMKMRSIAEKYGSVLDISYDKNRFTVMTALRLKA